jgi:hypothetical protein
MSAVIECNGIRASVSQGLWSSEDALLAQRLQAVTGTPQKRRISPKYDNWIATEVAAIVQCRVVKLNPIRKPRVR